MRNAPTQHDGTGERLFAVKRVAELLNCSTRHVWRLADSGKMPAPLKLGGLRRWNPATLEEWLNSGCPDLREGLK
jgi:excisionase family DNA binding protein